MSQPESWPGEMAVEIEYFTDPLCSWSWGFEPQWRRLRLEFGRHLRWRYRMGGMIPDWTSYSDPINSVFRPAHMAPQWIEVHHLSGMPIDARIWMNDPPQSSYPACIAFKAAEMQSPERAEKYLRRMREAVMMEGLNISRREVLARLAEPLAADAEQPLDVARFLADLDGPAALQAFVEDLKLARLYGLGRFPSLILRPRNGQELLVVGYRPYKMLRAALLHAAELEPADRLSQPEPPGVLWAGATPREISELQSSMADRNDLNEAGSIIDRNRPDGKENNYPIQPSSGVPL